MEALIDTVLLKVASRCNINCTYCYVYHMGDDNWSRMEKFMAPEIVEATAHSIKKIAGLGDQLKLGSGHEESQNSSPVINELNNYTSIRNKFLPASVIGALPTSMAGHALKSVTRDANGTYLMTVTDLAKQPLMTARADGTGWLTVTNSFTLQPSPAVYQATFSTGSTTDGTTAISAFSVSSNEIVTIYRSGSQIYNDKGNGFQFNSASEPSSATYLIQSAKPFNYSYTQLESSPTVDGGNTVLKAGITQMSADYIESPGSATQYFQTFKTTPVSISGGTYNLINLSEEVFSGGLTAGDLPAGYFQASAIGTGNVTVSYPSYYSDISYNYYNQLGQLVKHRPEWC